MKPVRKVFDVYHNGRVILKVTSVYGFKAEEKAARMMMLDSRSLCAIESTASYMDAEIAKANSRSRFKQFSVV